MEQCILTKEAEATTGPKLNILDELLTMSFILRAYMATEAAGTDRASYSLHIPKRNPLSRRKTGNHSKARRLSIGCHLSFSVAEPWSSLVRTSKRSSMEDLIPQDRLSYYLPEQNLGLWSPSRVTENSPISSQPPYRSNSTCGSIGDTKGVPERLTTSEFRRGFWRARPARNEVNGLVVYFFDVSPNPAAV